jgi:toxin ParE1/3/4
MAEYTLTSEAQNSLKGIKAFSLKRFGNKRTTIYLKALRDRMSSLAENPTQGRERTDLFTDWLCYSYFEGSHTIFYEIKSKRIIILDVLHQSMDAKLHLLD